MRESDIKLIQLAFGQRTDLGDPDFVPGVRAKEQQWLDPGAVAARAKLLSDDRTFPPDYYKPPK